MNTINIAGVVCFLVYYVAAAMLLGAYSLLILLVFAHRGKRQEALRIPLWRNYLCAFFSLAFTFVFMKWLFGSLHHSHRIFHQLCLAGSQAGCLGLAEFVVRWRTRRQSRSVERPQEAGMRGQNDPEIPVERRTSPHVATTPAASSYSRVGIASFLCACVFLLVFFAFILEAVGSSYNIYKDNALESLIGIGAFILLIGFLLGIAGIIQSIFQAKKMLFNPRDAK